MGLSMQVNKLLSEKANFILYFYLEGCEPCEQAAPIIETLHSKIPGSYNFLEVDLSKNEQLGLQFGIQGAPVLLFFSSGIQRAGIFTLTEEYVDATFEAVISGGDLPSLPPLSEEEINRIQAEMEQDMRSSGASESDIENMRNSFRR